MNVEFVDTNILVYANSLTSGTRHSVASALMQSLSEKGIGAISTQVLSEFYSTVTGKYKMASEEAEGMIEDLRWWILHRPGHADIVGAIRLQRRYKIPWWDAMILNSAIEIGAHTLWSEDFSDGQRFGSLTVRNPFADSVH